MFLDLRPILVALGLSSVIGITGGYFIGKKYGGGWGALSGLGIIIASMFLLAMCRPCITGFRNLFTDRNNMGPVKSNRPV